MSLATDGERLCWLDPDAVIALDARTGAEAWRAERAVTRERPAWSAPTLVMHGPVVLCADRRAMPGPDVDESTGSKLPRWLAEGGGAGELTAYAAATGQKLWTTLCGEAYHAPIDVFVTDGLVWVGRSRARQGPDFTQGLDLLTGEVRCRLAPQRAFATTMPHHRCHRNRVAGRFLVTGRTGVEFIDLQTGDAWRHHWVRGSCQFGVIPANGLLYVPPHSCACYSEAKLTGLLALAPKCSTQDERPRTNDEDRLEQGPAYAEVMRPSSLTVRPADDWPTYRHDAARSGRTAVSVPAELKCGWQATLGGRLTSPVIADGRVLAAAVDAHTVYAVDASDGRRLWQFTAGGRIDSPPTVAGDRAVFGAADGWVYCLRTADGALAWRYRVAPDDRRCMAYGQLESPWPVHGSVLVHEDRVLCAAGRSSFLDGGIELCQLDLATGTKLTARRMDSRDPQTGDQPAEPIIFEMPGAQPDVLSTDGQRIFMRHLAFDLRTLEPRQAPPHLYSPAGFLDDHWWHRTYWIYGNHFYSGYIGWYFAGRETPAGRLLVLDETAVYGFAYRPEFYRTTTKHSYHLFGLDRQAVPTQPPADYARANRDYPAGGGGKFSIAFRWSADVPLLVRAMVLAGDRLFVAGPPADALQSLPAFSGQDGATLCAISAAEGKTLSAYRLDALPVFDGLAAAQGRLYLTLQDGRLLCLSDRHTTAGGTELRAKDPPPSTK
jgi:outer membrane protein assembly factor BamB